MITPPVNALRSAQYSQKPKPGNVPTTAGNGAAGLMRAPLILATTDANEYRKSPASSYHNPAGVLALALVEEHVGDHTVAKDD
jgi:hypothetical protein